MIGNCKDCEWFEGSSNGGICRRYAPRPDFVRTIPIDDQSQERDALGVWWPEVEFADWCGEFSQRGSEEIRTESEKPIGDLALSPRASRALDRIGVKTIGDLTEKNETMLWACPNTGIKTIREIKKALADRGLSLAP